MLSLTGCLTLVIFESRAGRRCHLHSAERGSRRVRQLKNVGAGHFTCPDATSKLCVDTRVLQHAINGGREGEGG